MTGPDIAWRAFAALLGPFAGDYAATWASAWPRRPTPLVGASRCALCGTEIAASRKVPLLSWLALRGRRPCCGGRIPLTYPLGEAAGLAAGLLAAVQPDPARGALVFAVVLTLAYVGLVDLRRFSIPVAGLCALAAAVVADLLRIGDPRRAAERLATGAVLALALFALRHFGRRGGRPGLGGGDVLLAALIGALVGWRLAPIVVALATLAPLAIQTATFRRSPTALGFWLCVAAAPVATWTIWHAK